MSYLFNILISGVSVSGDIDTQNNNLVVEMANADTIGHASFELTNSGGKYSSYLLSGNPSFEIDIVRNQIPVPLFVGTIEKAVPQVSVTKGSTVQFDGYDKGQELLNVVSPDARQPYLLTSSGTINVNSGDGGAGIRNGIDLVAYTSGQNASGSVSVAQFMSQWFGTSGDHTGSISGQLLTFKPYIAGYTWKTYYVPDSSGQQAAHDNNANYFLPSNKLVAKHEYAWDTLKKITRQQAAQDINGNNVPFEQYCDASGALHIFASGSYEIFASGVSIVYYQAGNSGSANNNVISAKIPYDLTLVKNFLDGWFPDWTLFPTDQDNWTSFIAFSGGNWSGINSVFSGSTTGTAIFAGPAAPNLVGSISIIGQTSGVISGDISDLGLIYTLNEGTFNIQQLNVSGTASSVNLSLLYRAILSGAVGAAIPLVQLQIYDLSGNYIIASGIAGQNDVFMGSGADTGWFGISRAIYTASGTFNSGDGATSGWAASATFPDLTNVHQIQITGSTHLGGSKPFTNTIYVDQLCFSFDYAFSPVAAFNSGSQGLYGRRYGVLEYPSQVSANGASGIMTTELSAQMGSQGIAEFVIRDNFNSNPISAQLNIKPGYVFIVDAPNLDSGSGQVFNLWRASKVTHNWSKTMGFETTIDAYPFYSGIGFSGTQNNNQINYITPVVYTPTIPAPERESYIPAGRPWPTGGRF